MVRKATKSLANTMLEVIANMAINASTNMNGMNPRNHLGHAEIFKKAIVKPETIAGIRTKPLLSPMGHRVKTVVLEQAESVIMDLKTC
jgi:hypothetical protein